jgi:hypothetical protein
MKVVSTVYEHELYFEVPEEIDTSWCYRNWSEISGCIQDKYKIRAIYIVGYKNAKSQIKLEVTFKSDEAFFESDLDKYIKNCVLDTLLGMYLLQKNNFNSTGVKFL